MIIGGKIPDFGPFEEGVEEEYQEKTRARKSSAANLIHALEQRLDQIAPQVDEIELERAQSLITEAKSKIKRGHPFDLTEVRRSIRTCLLLAGASKDDEFLLKADQLR